MRIIGITILLQLLMQSTFAQTNLVPNGGFENSIVEPINEGEMGGYVSTPVTLKGICQPWSAGSFWSSPDLYSTNGSSSFRIPNNISGYQPIQNNNGSKYAGLICHREFTFNYFQREYLQVKLLQPLTVGKTYNIQFAIALAEGSEYGSNMGFCMSTSEVDFRPASISHPPIIAANGDGGLSLSNAIHTDSSVLDTNWTLLCFKFTPKTTGLEYLLIGNFLENDSIDITYNTARDYNYLPGYQMAYYFVDNVIVSEEVANITLGNDTTLCTPAELTLSSPVPNTLWSNGTIGSSIKVNHSGIFWAEVTSTCSSKIRDTITISERSNCNWALPTAFSPNGDGVNDDYKIILGCELSNFNCRIYNRWGQKIFESDEQQIGWNGLLKESEQAGEESFICKISYLNECNNKEVSHIKSFTLLR